LVLANPSAITRDDTLALAREQGFDRVKLAADEIEAMDITTPEPCESNAPDPSCQEAETTGEELLKTIRSEMGHHVRDFAELLDATVFLGGGERTYGDLDEIRKVRKYVQAHRKTPEQQWALLESNIKALDQTVQRCQAALTA
jgi:hypothetical protein